MTAEHTIAPVSPSGSHKPAVPAEAPKAPRSGGLRRRLGLGLAVVILAGAGVWFGVFRSRGPADDLGQLQGEWVLAVSGRAVAAAMLEQKIAIGRTWPAMPTHVRVTIGTQDEMTRFQTVFARVMDS